MEMWLKFLITAQILPALLFLMALSGLILGLTSETDPLCIGCQYYGAVKPDPEVVWEQFWIGVEAARFFFIIGLPFEIWILYIEHSDKKYRGRRA